MAGQPYYTPLELSFTVYADGYTAVDYFSDVDPTRPRVNVTLFGSLYLDVLVEDQDGLLLGYSPSEGGLSIDTLGSISVLVSYFTQDLTGKSGQIWTISVSTPVDVSIILPGGSTIVSLSSVPLSMGSLGEKLLITMPVGEVEVSYTIGVAGTRERAAAIIHDTRGTIDGIKEEGIIVDEAETLLRQAVEALDAEFYAEAEQLAEEAKSSSLELQGLANIANSEIDQAGDAITVAEDVGNTVGLDDAKDLLQRAEAAYEAGEYAQAEELARGAGIAAVEATKEGGLPVIWIGAAGLVVAVAAGAFLLSRRGGGKDVGAPARFHLDRLFEEHPQLRIDDKEVLRFIAESGGEIFAAELRERFKVPRTSLWRMIRRLEREEVVEVSSVGGQSLVKIGENYREGGS
ncbi:MAG: hypothetical protein V3S09_03695 [Candidatus Bathyarchaeia archaeon]